MPRIAIPLCLCAGLLNAQPASLTGDWVNVLSHFDQKGYSRMTLAEDAGKLSGTNDDMKLTGTVRNGKIQIEAKNDHGRSPAK